MSPAEILAKFSKEHGKQSVLLFKFSPVNICIGASSGCIDRTCWVVKQSCIYWERIEIRLKWICQLNPSKQVCENSSKNEHICKFECLDLWRLTFTLAFLMQYQEKQSFLFSAGCFLFIFSLSVSPRGVDPGVAVGGGGGGAHIRLANTAIHLPLWNVFEHNFCGLHAYHWDSSGIGKWLHEFPDHRSFRKFSFCCGL